MTPDLEPMSREELILKARVLGVERAELMTRVELRDEIVRRSEPDIAQQKRARGFLGVARDLVASVVEAGLNLPDAAALIRGDGSREGEWKGPPPVATVTLAEIYAAQGHVDRALTMLNEVLAKEPDHDPARALRDRLAAAREAGGPGTRRRKPVVIDVPVVEEEAEEPAPDSDAAFEPPGVPEPAPIAVAEIQPDQQAEEVVVAPEVVAAPEVLPAPQPAASVVSGPAQPCALTLSVTGTRHAYWEVPEDTWSALRRREPNGRAVLRVMSFRTRAGRVERRARDLPIEAAVGGTPLSESARDWVVRAALGWSVGERFIPFVIATDLGPIEQLALRPGHPVQFRAHRLVGFADTSAEQRAASYVTRRSRV